MYVPFLLSHRRPTRMHGSRSTRLGGVRLLSLPRLTLECLPTAIHLHPRTHLTPYPSLAHHTMSASQFLSAGSSKLGRPRRSQSPTVPQPMSTSDHLPTQPGVPSAPSSASPRSHSDSASSSVRASVPWPLSDPKLCLFFDPFSVRAAEVKTGLEVSSSSLLSPSPLLPSTVRHLADARCRSLLPIQSLLKLSGSKLNTASVVQSATHLVLDPAEELNRSLRARAGQAVQGRENEDAKQRVVTLDWAKSSFFAGRGLPEKDFGFDDDGRESPADEAVDVDGGTESEVESESERVDSMGRPNPRVWVPDEEEDAARWLASDPQKKSKEDGGSIWDQYAHVMVSPLCERATHTVV